MRPLVLVTMASLDGVMQAPGGPEEDTSGDFPYGGWSFPYFSEEMGGPIVESFGKAEDFLLGRTTYQVFAAHWPRVEDSDDPVSSKLNALPKHVASTTLDEAEWHNAHIIDGDVVDAVRKLKSQDGGELQVHGSAGLIQTLLEHDLVDEIRLTTFPVVLGQGKRLFGDGARAGAWTLVSSSTSSTGAVFATYRRSGEVETGSFALDD